MSLRAGRIIVAVLALGATITCVRLGFWQLQRAGEKRAAGAERAALLAAPPIELGVAAVPEAPEPGRRVHLRGRWERDRHILLSGRTHLGAAGVALVTPVLLESGERVLVERGWLEAADAITAHPEAWPDSVADVIGVVVRFTTPPRRVTWTRLDAERPGVELWSARVVDSAQVAVHVPAPVAPWLVRALSENAPAAPHGLVPLGVPPGESGERVHLSYAIQWFAFALIVIAGTVALLLRDARRGGSGTHAGPRPGSA